MKKLVQSVARGVCKVGDFISRNGKTFVVVGFTAAGAAICQAQTDASVIATTASSDFAIIAPITITIVTFYVILKLARRTVK